MESRRLSNGHKLRIAPIPAMRSLALMSRIAKVASKPFLQQLATGEFNTVTFIILVSSQLDPETIQDLARESLRSATLEVDGKLVELDSDEAINQVFTGQMFALLEATKHAIEVHYGDFFAKASVLFLGGGSDKESV
jgi:hypothetical protein